MELYKKHRPRSLKTVVGNKATVATLKNMIERKTIPHAILFYGPTGCGKTTLARIVEKELGCGAVDFQELNCSAFRGIDTIRDIERVMFLAPIDGECRVWLLDEFHQMTSAGMHAALKMLEDTPDHVYFLLCTTEPQKLLKTVRNRCSEMPVEYLDEKDMTKLIVRICKREKITIKPSTIEDLIDASEGSARRCLVILDKIKNLPSNKRSEAIGQPQEDEKEGIDLCRALINEKTKWPTIAKILRDIKGEPESIRWSVMGYCTACLMKKSNHYIFHVLTCFENHFYDSKKNGLVSACYQAKHGEV